MGLKQLIAIVAWIARIIIVVSFIIFLDALIDLFCKILQQSQIMSQQNLMRTSIYVRSAAPRR